MAPDKRRPPMPGRRRFENVLLGQRLDTFEDCPSRPIPQDHPRRLRRKRAAGRRPPGPGERAAARACRERGFRVIEGGRT